MNPHRTENYDVEQHLKARNMMFACWALMVMLWGIACFVDWRSALCSMVANGLFLVSIGFFLKLYPEK